MTCQEYKEWVEEKWEEPIKSRKSGYKQECKKKKCKKKCLCCNKWTCSLLTFWYWLVEWVIRIIAKWIVYVTCRTIVVLLTLLDAIWNGLWGLYCKISTAGTKSPTDIERLNDLNLRSMKTLRLQAVIVDRDDKTSNQVTEASLKAMIAAADRILTERAHIRVKQKGSTRRTTSKALYDMEGGSAGGVGEWVLNIGRLIGRDSPLHMTVYAVGRIGGGAQGVHYPLYGSVFVTRDSQVTTLCHELGHALLNVGADGHDPEIKNLMYAGDNEAAAGWPSTTPTLTPAQWCAMRTSRWLDFEWSCEACA